MHAVATGPVRDPASEAEVASALAGDVRPPVNPASFVDMALRHRVAPLLVRAGVSSALPRREAERLVEDTRREAVIAAVRDRELSRVLSTLAAAGIDVLLMKGAALAYSHYPESYLRPRDDADLLIAPADRERVVRALERQAYEHVPDITGDAVLGQILFERPGVAGSLLDVHWRLTARRVTAGLLPFDELRARAVPVPRLGPTARAPAPVDALALACIHQSAHHPEHDLLLWAYDTHLLVSGFSAAEADEFFDLVVQRKMVGLSVYALEEAVRAFPSSPARSLLDRLKVVRHEEPTARLIEPRTSLENLRLDLASTSGVAARAELIWAHLFPPAAYMRRRYGVRRQALLPWFYACRVARGARRWLTERRPV